MYSKTIKRVDVFTASRGFRVGVGSPLPGRDDRQEPLSRLELVVLGSAFQPLQLDVPMERVAEGVGRVKWG